MKDGGRENEDRNGPTGKSEERREGARGAHTSVENARRRDDRSRLIDGTVNPQRRR